MIQEGWQAENDNQTEKDSCWCVCANVYIGGGFDSLFMLQVWLCWSSPYAAPSPAQSEDKAKVGELITEYNSVEQNN